MKHFLILAVFLSVLPVASAQDAELNRRLDALTSQFEERRKEFHVPGMALAIIKDDEVILSRGFGLADIEAKKPVTPETMFAIGSTTKAFTATLIGMLVDEGKMTWDDPVSSHLSFFKLAIDAKGPDTEVTIRDLLCHRTGFTRMGLLWASGRVSREEILRTATKAEPWAPFREKFLYNNVTFLAAGEAAAAATGTSWDAMIAKRIFEPLGMKSSNTSFKTAQADDRLSLGYDGSEEDVLLPMRNVDSVGPSGSINSNVVDMANWVRFQLGRGVFGGKRFISEQQFDETHAKQISMGGGVDYGFGWMLRDINGKPLVEHGGSIDGFGAQVSLFPNDNLGFVLLTNVTMSPLQALSNQLVAETLLGDPKKDEGEPKEKPADPDDLQSFLGKYDANFGPFQDKIFTVQIQNGKLAVDVPGQIVYELKAPDEKGKWYFALTDQIAVSFERDDNNAVEAMTMYQAGMEFELPRQGVKRKPEVDLDEVKKYVGRYEYNKQTEFQIKVLNGRLAVVIPGKLTSELHPPDDEGKWKFRVVSDRSVKFEITDEGKVGAMILFRDGREPKNMPRISDKENNEGKDLPSLSQVLALRDVEGRGQVFDKIKSLRLTGTVRIAQSGVEGTSSILMMGGDRARVEMNLGRFGRDTKILNRERGWVDSTFQPRHQLTGKYLEQAWLQLPSVLFGDWRQFFKSQSVIRNDKVAGRKAHVVKLESDLLSPVVVYVDAETGDLLKSEMEAVSFKLKGLSVPVVTLYEDHRDTGGVRMPWRSISENEMAGRVVSQIKKLETDVTLEDGLFERNE